MENYFPRSIGLLAFSRWPLALGLPIDKILPIIDYLRKVVSCVPTIVINQPDYQTSKRRFAFVGFQERY